MWHPKYILSMDILCPDMDPRLSQLKRDFHNKLLNLHNDNEDKSSISLLTKEELRELETIWVQHIIWKENNINA